uniref:G-protein coupled receptors family 2 profile 2 domain-containing protein n=1 Tax=Strigamia maritima TaxID=126957 RepID=T1J4S7_STRMM
MEMRCGNWCTESISIHFLHRMRLVLYLSVAALLDNVGFFMGGLYTDGHLCNFEALWLTLFEWSVLLWVCCITFNIFFNAILYKKTESYEIVYHMICWALPFIIALSPLVYKDFYGPAGAWCWIQKEFMTWRFVIWYGPLFVLITILFIMYAIIIMKMKKRASTWEGTYSPELERLKKIFEDDAKRLYGYPFVYLITSICPVLNRIQNAINPDHPVYSLWILHCLFAPLPGAINVIIFGLDQDIRSKLTWLQIKATFLARFEERTIIQEYSPFEDDTL